MKGKLFKIAMAGKITVGAGIFSLLAIALLSTVGFVSTTADAARSATTTVKVLNTPPQFKSEPGELIPSTQANPTTFGNTISFKVDAADSSNNGMYLLVCKSDGEPIASSTTAPVCKNADPIAVTESPVVGTYPTPITVYATSSPIDDTANEAQAWYAFLCDNETRNPRCTKVGKQGTPAADEASPYYINHPHNFSALAQDGPKLPGETLTFTATVGETMHADVNGPQDTIKLFVCKAQDFTGTDCGAGGTWASSTAAVPTNSTAQITFGIPYQDNMYSGYGYVLDSHGAVAVGTAQSAKIDFAVANAAPKVTASSITFTPTRTLVLTNPLAETTGFGLTFETTDDNSCQNSSSEKEMKSVKVQLGRNSLFATTCKEGSAFNANNCYSGDVDTTTWNLSCIQNDSSCTGKNDPSTTWNCTFPLWSNADPTDAPTPWKDDNWNARVSVQDDNTATGTSAIDDPGRYAIVQSFPFIELGADTIDFGEFEPGQTPPDLGTATAGSVLGIKSQGNTAFDLDMQTSDMCPNFDGVKCTGDENSNTIFGIRQHYATGTVPYWSAAAATGSTSTLSTFDINVKKPIATGTPSTRNIYWGIQVPATLMISGDYKGVNNIEIKNEANLSTW